MFSDDLKNNAKFFFLNTSKRFSIFSFRDAHVKTAELLTFSLNFVPFFVYQSDLHETEVWYQWNHGGSDFRNFESRKSKFLGNFDPFWLKNLTFLVNFTRLTRNGAIFFWVIPGACELVERVDLSLLNKFDTYHVASWCIWDDVENPEYWVFWGYVPFSSSVHHCR